MPREARKTTPEYVRLGYKTYAEYLASPKWKEIREETFRRKGRKCYVCGKKAECVHHKTYSKRTMEGKTRSLIPLCKSCHVRIEFTPQGQKRTLHQANRELRRLRDRFQPWEPDIISFATTEQDILALQTAKGGWTRKSLASLGVPWPPPKGWKRRLLEGNQNELSGSAYPVKLADKTDPVEQGKSPHGCGAGSSGLKVANVPAKGSPPSGQQPIATAAECAPLMPPQSCQNHTDTSVNECGAFDCENSAIAQTHRLSKVARD